MSVPVNRQVIRIISSDEILLEEENVEDEFQPAIDLTSSHKRIFLRFIKAEMGFLTNPDLYPDYLSIMVNDLNELDFSLDSHEWIEILNAWTEHVQNEYRAFLRTKNGPHSLSDEDEELIQQIQENKLWTKPSVQQINYALDHLETSTSFSEGLWTTIATGLQKFGGQKKSAMFWNRVFQRLWNRVNAKQELIAYCAKNHPKQTFINKSLFTLLKWETRLAKIYNRKLKQRRSKSPQQTSTELENLLSHCRICLASTSSKMTYLFGADDKTHTISVLEKLNYCSCMSTAPHVDDDLPQYICMSCSVLLESAYQLKVLCSQTEEKLMSLVDKQQTCENKGLIHSTEQNPLSDTEDYTVPKEDYIIDEITEEYDDTGEAKVNYELTLVDEKIDDDLEEQTNVVVIESVYDKSVQSESADTEAGADEPIILNDNKSKKTKGIRQKKRKTTEKSPSLRCRICARRNFSNENSLKVHMKTHGIDKKHQCSVCNKHFKTAVILTVHLRSHTGERPYVCETCGKAFKTVSAVNNHRAIHSELKEFQCPHCPYQASTKANLKIHDRTHTGVQPYECRYCAMKFSTASNMHKHMRNIHQKLKTHKCDECDRSFFTRDSARKHMVTHTGLKPYVCTECPMSYSWYNGLKKHVKQQHANIKIPTETSFYKRIKNDATQEEKE